MSKQKLLITGGAGFIGSSLIDVLIKPAEIVVVDNFDDFYDPLLKENNLAPHLKSSNLTLYRADINNNQALEVVFAQHHFDAIIHIAARAGVRPSIVDPRAYFETNVMGTLNLLELIKKYQVPKLIFASSSSVYGNCEVKKFREDLPLSQPISPYASTKLAGEQLIYTYAHLYHFQALCLRFFTVYGPRQRPDLAINKFMTLLEQDQLLPVYGDGSSQRDYTYISDIVAGVMGALTYQHSQYEIINLGGGSPLTLAEMIKTMEQILGKKAQLNYLPVVAGDVERTSADISKAQKLLAYQPQINFKTGLQKYYQWRLTQKEK